MKNVEKESLFTEDFIKEAGELRVLAVIISKDGEEVARHLWEPICFRNIYSASKSFTSCAVGLAVKEGLIRLDEKLTDAFAEDLPETVPENLKKAEVRDLLTMCLGQESGSLMGAQRPLIPEDDWVKLVLSKPFPYEPGTHFVYNNAGPYLAGILVQRRAGCDLVSYLMPRLFEPLGIKRPAWECDPKGNTFGAGGLMISIDALHKFGMLYLQNGVWNGRRILTEEWVKASTSWQNANDRDPYGYGYLFWGGDKGSFRADGKYGQFSIILRDKNAVITLVSECRDTKALKELIFRKLYPSL